MELHEELLFLNEEDVLSLLTPADAIAAPAIVTTMIHIKMKPVIRFKFFIVISPFFFVLL